MKTLHRIPINLDRAPHERWGALKNYSADINALYGCYLKDLDDAGIFSEMIDYYKENYITESYLEEIQAMVALSNYTEDQILITNLYYDALKIGFGCTAFACDITGMAVHARNLDWWTDHNLLKDKTLIFDYQKQGKTLYSSVGWPGFLGVLSGVRKGAFSISLNAVLSNEPAQLAPPITFLIREVLEEVDTYDEAVKRLSETPIATDCLLLVTGVEPDQKVVIERTPTRYEWRNPEDGLLVVTNEYLKLEDGQEALDTLQATATSRYQKVQSLYKLKKPKGGTDCLRMLSDNGIRMDITMQQMLLYPKTGTIELKI